MSQPPAGDFVKSARGVDPAFHVAEAAGLAWLTDAEASGGTRVVRVRDLDRETGTLTLERLQVATATHRAAQDLGRSLAATHATGAPAFGSPPPDHPVAHGWIGRQRQPMDPTPTWGRFYAEQRVLPFLRAAVDVGTITPGGARLIEAVCDRLLAGELDDDRPPARIHGDLWDGNVVHTESGAVLIDPAAHGGHGETDLAMLALFGTPHLERVQDAYAEAAELKPGWRDRVALHQLHPLCVHAVSHGRSYGLAAAEAARPYC